MDNIQSATISQLSTMATSGTKGVEAMAQMEANLSTTINNALQPLYQYSKAYANGHAFAYDAHLVPLEWFANHQGAFHSLENALSVVNNTADAMSLLSPSMMQTIGSLPSDLATTLVGAITSLALVRSTLATARGKTNGRNINHTQDELGKEFGERIMGQPSSGKQEEINDMLDDEIEQAEETERENSK